MNPFFMLDVRPDPTSPTSLVVIVVFLLIVFVLSAVFVAGLVYLLIRNKRRKLNQASMVQTPPA